MPNSSPSNLVALFFDQARLGGDGPFLWARGPDRWRPTTWNEAAAVIRRLASALRRQGIGHGDRVLLVSENRPEWLLADLAILTAGAITVPAYVTSTIEDHRHILLHSGARAVIVSSKALLQRLQAACGSDRSSSWW